MKKAFICSFICLFSLATNLHGQPKEGKKTLKRIECKVTPLELTTKGLKRQYAYTSDARSGNGIATHIPLTFSSSLNWSGYAALTSLKHPANYVVTDVSGSWRVPTISPSDNTTYSSAWVGMDGYSNGTVEQIGTEHDWFDGAQDNYAWFEMYPRGAFQIVGFPVDINDRMGAEVKYVGNHTFKLTIINFTQNVFTVIPSFYTKLKAAKRSSAEWIVEAPSSVDGVLPLANFGTISFTNCIATIQDKQGTIKAPHRRYDAITMKTPAGIIKSFPSVLSNGGTAFSMTWAHE